MPVDHRRGFETQREELVGETLSVEGDLPDWLAGRYVRNGPGQFEVGDRDLDHWFDPLAMVRSVAVREGRVEYTNRFVRSRDFEFARQRGRVRTPFPGTAPDRPVYERVRQTLSGVFPDNPVIGIARVHGRLAAVTESPVAFLLDPETLRTERKVWLTGDLDVDLTLGHCHYDPRREATVNLGVSYGGDTEYVLFRRPDGERRPRPVGSVVFDNPSYVHSFALTDRYAVLPEFPYGLDAGTLLTNAVTGGTFVDAFRSFDQNTRFHVLDRETGDRVARVHADPAFVYHHVNAFPDGDELVVDAVAFPDERAVTGLTMSALRERRPDLPQGDLVRYRLPLSGGRADRETIRTGPLEFPTFDYANRLGRRHGYVYVAETDRGALPTAIAKVSVPGGTTERWQEDRVFPGEPIFVPRSPSEPDDGDPGGSTDDAGEGGSTASDSAADDPPGEGSADGGGSASDPERAEDDGVLVTLALDAAADRSLFLVLDARSMEELARAPLPHRLPYGFHGQFYGFENPTRSMA